MPGATRYQGFCFTHNNYTQDDWDKYVKSYTKGDIAYLIMGRETAPSTGTAHIQGFMWLPAMQTLQNVKKKYKAAWIEAPGTEKGPAYWQDYCSKQDANFFHKGNPPTDDVFRAQAKKGAGARNDLLEIKKKIDAGIPAESLMADDQHFVAYASHRKFFTEYQAYKRRRTAFTKPQVTVYYGGTGRNKTRRVHATLEGNYDDFWEWTPDSGQWFDGYAGQNIVLFDEFRGQLPFGMILKLLDGYAGRRVQVKGGSVMWSPTVIYLTSPTHPDEWYPNLTANDKIDQLTRRIDNIEQV